MSWQATVPARLGTVDKPGFCLRFSQSFFGAPAMWRSARHAWDALPEKYGPEVPGNPNVCRMGRPDCLRGLRGGRDPAQRAAADRPVESAQGVDRRAS